MNDHVDMSQFIAARSDQLNADDLMDNPRTITITKVTASPDSAEQPVSIHYQGGEGRPFKPCKTMRRIMVAIWGKDASHYVGRSMTLYRDPDVQFGGMKVGGIRVSHMSHLPEKKTVALLVTRGRKAPYTVHPLTNVPAATTEDAASRWANAYIGKLITFTKLDEIAALENAQAARLVDLKAKRPELHERLAAAAEAARSKLGNDDLNAGFEDDPSAGLSPAEVAVDKAIADAESATDLAELGKVIAEAEKHKTFLPDELAVKLEVAFDKARQRLAKAEAEAANV